MAQRAKDEAPSKPRRLSADPGAPYAPTQGQDVCGKPKAAPRAAKPAAKNPAAGRKRTESQPRRPAKPSAEPPKTLRAGPTPPRPADAVASADELAAAGTAAPAGIEAGAAQGAAKHGAEPSLAQRLLALGRQTEMSSLEALRREKKLAWRIAVFNGALLAVSLTGYAFLLPLKQSVPYVVQVDKLTGETSTLEPLGSRTSAPLDAQDKSLAAQYVRARESYDWHTIKDTYAFTNLMSSPQTQREFHALYESKDSPDKLLRDNYKVTVDILAVSRIGELMQVRFVKKPIPMSPAAAEIPPQRMIATIKYGYVNGEAKESDRLINPLGYRVYSYEAVPEQEFGA